MGNALVDFDGLAAFVAVARLGSFSRAAAELHRSQPGVSRHVQRLERDLGATLLERRGGRPRPTPAGEQVLRYAEKALADRQALLETIRAASGPLAGDLRIGASTTPGEFVVPDLVASFVRQHPAVRPTVAIADTAVIESDVREGRCDNGFVGARLSGRGLRYRPVAEDEVVLAVPARHPFAAQGEVGLAELAGLPFLDREGGSGTAASVRHALDRHGLRLPDYRAVMVLGSSPAIVAAVERGLGVGWVSSLALECRNPERIAAVRLAGVPVRRMLSLVDDPKRTPSPVARAFVERVLSARAEPRRCP